MNKFTTEERVKILEFYFEKKHSTILTQRFFMRHFNVRHSPTKPTKINLVKHFPEQDSFANRSQPGQGLSVCTTENVWHSIFD